MQPAKNPGSPAADTHGPSSPEFSSPAAGRPSFFGGGYLLLYLCGVALLLGAVFAAVSGYEFRHIRDERYRELRTISRLKAGQILSWRQERRDDAAALAADPLFQEGMDRFARHPEDAGRRDALRRRLQLLLEHGGYQGLIVADLNARILLTLDPRLKGLETTTRRLHRQAMAAAGPVFGDFFRCPDCLQVHLDVAVPIPDTQGRLVAVLFLRSDPERSLYPLVQSWPEPSASAETLLVRREGDMVVFVNRLRHSPAPALTLRQPLSLADLPAAQVVKGKTGMFEGRDYRGKAVLADLRPLPGTAWFMVAKLDREEFLIEVWKKGLTAALFVLGLLVAVGLSLALFLKHRGKKVFQSLYHAERERRLEQEIFRTTLYSIGDGVITTDRAGAVRQMNGVAEKLTGWREDEALGRPATEVFRIVSEESGLPAADPVARVLESGMVVGLANHTLLLARDGRATPIADSGAPIRDAGGGVAGVVLVFRDQTAERDRRRLLELRLGLFDYAANHSLPELLQKTLDEVGDLTGSPAGFYHFVDMDQQTLTLQAWSTRTVNEFCQAKGQGMHYGIDKAGVWVDCVRERRPVIHNDYQSLPHRRGLPPGHTPVIRELVVPILRQDKIVAILGVGNKAEDYSEKDAETVAYLADVAWEIVARKKGEEAFAAMAARMEALLEAIPDIVMEVDRDKVYCWANPAGLEFFGPEVVGREASFYFEGQQETYSTVQPLFEGGADIVHLESWQRRRDGEKRLLSWCCRVLRDGAGAISGAISSARDITEESRREEQLNQARKMESVGQLAGGVAHDFNNMLSVILGYTDLALKKLGPGHPAAEYLREVENAGRRSADLTRQLLAFARKQTVSPRVMDLNDTVRGTLKLLRRIIGEDIELLWRPGGSLWPVCIDPAQMDQILANLLSNARDAIDGNGNVTLETRNVVFDADYCTKNAGYVPGDYVLLAVSDSGQGMDHHTLARVFEPFFTTKEMGKGTGLGLATVYGIVKQNAGFVNLYSEPGQGTVCKVYLPRVRDREKGLEAVAVDDAVVLDADGSETILLVEDEAAILALAGAGLEQHGYTVLAASSPAAALEMVARHPGPIQLLVTDVVMPGMNGRQLYEKLRETRKELRVLYVSGYTANVIAQRGVLEANVQFLPKPFTVKNLALKVRETLIQPAGKKINPA